MNEAEFKAMVAAHGGIVSAPVKVSPDTVEVPEDPNDTSEGAIKVKVPVANPIYKYIFKDGTAFTARSNGGPPTWDETGHVVSVKTWPLQVIDAGDVFKPKTGDVKKERTTDPSKLIRIYDPNAPQDGSARVIKLIDPNTGEVTDVPDSQATSQGSVTTFDGKLIRINPNGSITTLATAADKATTVQFGEKLYAWDGKTLTEIASKPADPTKPITQTDKQGTVWEWDPAANEGKGGWKPGPGGVQKPAGTMSVNTTAKKITFFDDQGNVLSTVDNPGYQEPTPTALTPPGTGVKKQPFLKADGTVDWVDSPNYVSVTDATIELARQLGVKVASGSMSEEQAQQLITSAVNTMNAQSQAQNANTSTLTAGQGVANTALDAISSSAQTGAGLINQRLQTSQGMLDQVLGLAGQGQSSDGIGGGMMSAPAGLGANLVSGIKGFTAELAGGQETYDAAARLVQRADPGGKLGADAAGAYSALAQMLQKYKELYNEPHPAEVAVADTKPPESPPPPGSTPTPTPTPTPAPTTQTWGIPGAGGFKAPNQMLSNGQPAPANNGLVPGMPRMGAPTSVAPFQGTWPTAGNGFTSPPVTPPTPTININMGAAA